VLTDLWERANGNVAFCEQCIIQLLWLRLWSLCPAHFTRSPTRARVWRPQTIFALARLFKYCDFLRIPCAPRLCSSRDFIWYTTISMITRGLQFCLLGFGLWAKTLRGNKSWFPWQRALYVKMLVLTTTISVPNFMLVSKSVQFAWNFELCRRTMTKN